MKSLVVVLALLLAACSTGSHPTAARPTTTTLPSTVRPTTTTTTPTVVTEAALVGTWRPISILGYTGPLTSSSFVFAPSISFDGDGHWNGTDGCDRFGGSYRLGSGGTIEIEPGSHSDAACGVGGLVVPSPDSVFDAVRVELLNDRLTFFLRNGNQLAQYERATVTTRVVLQSTTMTAGSSMSGHVIVENNTGGALKRDGCGSLFSVFLSNTFITPHPFFPACIQIFTIPVGQSSYPVTVDATYLECAGPLGNGRPCSERNGHAVMPSLPPGEYQATLWGNIVPTPPPIAVRVTPQRSAP